jgi:nitroimidazol reductase NimA-like FMN-containing flavoprotein (pyridoxamine 5'-phosphate oxidase superfamily)
MEYDNGSSRSRVRRKPERARYDRQTVHEVLDAGLICHVGVVRDGLPVVVPMTYGREDDTLYLHGRPARASRATPSAAKGCV